MPHLRTALQKLVKAIDNYLEDAQESGMDNYDLDALVPIPMEQPVECEEYDPEWLAWQIKVAVIGVQDAYAAAGKRRKLPPPGLTHWRALLARSRVHADGVAIYEAADNLRDWAQRVEEANATGDPVGTDAAQTTMDGLSGRTMRLFRFIVGRSHKTPYEELRDDSDVFTIANITDEGIKTGIKDLIRDLNAIDAPFYVESSHGDKWVKLVNKPQPNQGLD